MTASTFDPDANLAAIVARTALATPGAAAVMSDTLWSYDDVHRRLLAYARGLAGLQLQTESTIAVLVPRDRELLPLLLAILWSGGAYVPIDPEEPAARAIRMLRIAGCAAIVCSEADYRRLTASVGRESLPMHVAPASLRQSNADAPAPQCAPGGARLAYVLFTSGSTGEPKGVEIEHRHLVHLLHAGRDLLRFGSGDRFLATATLAFDISVAELFLPLIAGGSVLLRDRTLLRDPARLAHEIRTHGVTAVQFGPSAWSVLLSENSLFPRVRTAVTIGEPISPGLAARLANTVDEAWNIYGPTETTVWATAHRLLPDAGCGPSKISAPIGKPLDGYTMLVADENGNPVPDGQDGELWIGGAAVARGYRDRPELTGARFVGSDGGRRYRTGDLVSRDAHGVLHYFGRNDDQIKVRGARIEPREIETALLRVPGVTQAAATWYDRPDGSRSIVAAIVQRAGENVSTEHMRAHLERALPVAMVPSRFVMMDRLPLTTSGKIDRSAIRNASDEPLQPKEPSYARSLTLSDTEARLAMIWEHALGVEKVEIDDDFFDRGGDSLSAVTMALDVEKLFDVQLSAQAVWETPRLQNLAALIDEARFKPHELGNTSIVYPMMRPGDDRPLFLSGIGFKPTDEIAVQLGCPLYGLSQWAHGMGFVKAGSIGELARAQIAEIRRIQPEGPYRLGGYSLGGLIVLEIARQLRQDGSEVDLLFLLDPMMPPHYKLRADGIAERAPAFIPTPVTALLRTHMAAIRNDPRKGLRAFWSRVVIRIPLWQWLSYRLVDRHGRRPNALTRWLLPKHRWPAFWYAARTIARDYVASPYDGPCLAVFHADDDRRKVWSTLLTGPADLHLVESTHLGMFFEPALSRWMVMLAEALKSANPPLR